MLKNGKLYGSIIPADVHSLRIKDVTLGDKVDLQILALTDHPVGRQEAKDSPNEGDSGIEASTVHDVAVNSECRIKNMSYLKNYFSCLDQICSVLCQYTYE